jgi:hypothetical protein
MLNPTLVVRLLLYSYAQLQWLLLLATSYEIDGKGERWIGPEPKVPTLLYIGSRDRVTDRTIRLTDCVPNLLYNVCNRLILTIV